MRSTFIGNTERMRIMASHEAFVAPSGFLIDIDGTIFRGNELIEGAKEAICMLRKMNKKVVFLSNRGNISRNMCRKNCSKPGLTQRNVKLCCPQASQQRF